MGVNFGYIHMYVFNHVLFVPAVLNHSYLMVYLFFLDKKFCCKLKTKVFLKYRA